MDDLLLELRKTYGKDAEFRDGQVEAIRGVLSGRRALVVQRTGWGKSLVYFLSTKMLRKQNGNGFTLIISPLLALMNNQVETAKKLGLHVETINSSNQDNWQEILEEMDRNTVDALIISPERLSNDEFKSRLSKKLAKKIFLFVVDEAHCISDWGHDFRPDYRRIVDIVKMLPSNIPVLATTATANERVVNDIKHQLGEDILISRGHLIRESLSIQVIKLPTKEERLAWILENLNKIEGTGIIYCLTVSDCKMVNKWLNTNGIDSEAYYSNIDNSENKSRIIDKFMKNEIKVLVATVAFGMGFDKPDIGFVIHFQKPANLIAYYQQIGRAGRAISNAIAILLVGNEDDEINHYFIESAFPTENLMNGIVEYIRRYPGVTVSKLTTYINMRQSKIKDCVKYLEVNGDIYADKGRYYKTPKPWKPDLIKSQEITRRREEELIQMKKYTETKSCYMEYIARALDDPLPQRCGKCANCLQAFIIPEHVARENVIAAQQFVKNDFNIIEPRKKWPDYVKIKDRNKISEDFICEQGRVLSNYGDAGWGKLVLEGKYKKEYFDNQLVDASYDLLKDFVVENDIKWITNISSVRKPNLVKSFTEHLANKLGLTYKDVIEKKPGYKCQKEFNNNYSQYNNAFASFEVINPLNENVLLVDDMVDSRWTFTVCGYKLREKGCGKVYPYALANSAARNGDE